jgi:predicted alpha-1,2-mannosidase
MKKKIVLSGGASRLILAVAGRMRQRVSPLLAAALSMLAGSLPVSAQTQDLVKYANTLQGTQSDFGLSYGNVNPVISLPFGMNAWSAQTGKDGDGWKYQYQARTIRAFGQSHQCSPWMGDYGVFTLMPVLDSVKTNEDQRALGFSHADETAQPSYYGVKLDGGVKVEMTPTERGTRMRFSFPKGRASYLMLDGYTKLSQVKIDPQAHTISGWVNNGHWVPGNFKNYFIIQFNQPFKAYGTWENEHGTQHADSLEGFGKGEGAYIQFKPGTVVEAKIASSYISPEQALVTLHRELDVYSSFEETRKSAEKVWNTLFNRVLVEGGTEAQKTTFYSCMFRANLFSHTFFEIDSTGKPYYYSPYDFKVHAGYMYSDNGFWDTFRSQFPLTIILHPTMQGQYVQALLDAQKQCGWLPAWSAPSETGGMLGNHAISLLTDAWVKGVRTFNPDSALKAYAHEAFNKGPWGGANGRQGWKEYYEVGYVPYPEYGGSTAATLEYAYDDFCAYNLAKMTGNTFYEGVFAKQMYNYRNVFNPSTGFMQGRSKDGAFTPDFDPYEWGGPFTEGNAWHWNWSVFHDVQGLINLMGGRQHFINRIDSVFSAPSTVHYGTYGGMIHEMKEMVIENLGQYAHGNQPILHMIYLYSYAGQPWKTQYHIRQAMERLYSGTPQGYPGDEDEGAMSSWYVLSAMGIYAVCPGTEQYVLGSPVFNKVTITMEDGKKFVIEAPNNSKDNVYISGATLNGATYTHNFITYDDMVKGGVLHLDMSNQPNTTRGLQDADIPFSLSKAQ